MNGRGFAFFRYVALRAPGLEQFRTLREQKEHCFLWWMWHSRERGQS